MAAIVWAVFRFAAYVSYIRKLSTSLPGKLVMRIIHALFRMEFTGDFNGVEAHVLTLAEAQRARGHSILAVTNARSRFTELCGEHGIPTVIKPELKQPPGESANRETVDDLISMFADFNADVIHCHLGAAWYTIQAANIAQIPCVFTFHAGATGLRSHEHLRFSAIAVCTSLFERVRETLPPDIDLHLVRNGSRCPPAGIAGIRKTGGPNLMLVGSLVPEKGFDVAILSMSVLRKRLGQACPVLNIYGNGPAIWADYAKEMVEALDLTPLVLFRGHQPDILNNSTAGDILVVASRQETGPMVVVEAMSHGMPIVTTRVGEVSEMLPDSRYGRIIPVNSIMSLADGIESTLSDITNERFDADLLIARHRLYYSDIVMAERVDEIYALAIQKESIAK
jgi:glycosyltransferase involved in cell wall biosynthesis